MYRRLCSNYAGRSYFLFQIKWKKNLAFDYPIIENECISTRAKVTAGTLFYLWTIDCEHGCLCQIYTVNAYMNFAYFSSHITLQTISQKSHSIPHIFSPPALFKFFPVQSRKIYFWWNVCNVLKMNDWYNKPEPSHRLTTNDLTDFVWMIWREKNYLTSTDLVARSDSNCVKIELTERENISARTVCSHTAIDQRD